MATLPRNSPDYNVPIDMATSYGLPKKQPPFIEQLSNLYTAVPSPPCRSTSKTAARRTCSP